jgi:hypothetical protein
MIQRGGGFGFIEKTFDGLLVAGEIRCKEFEHNVAAKLGVFGFIDNAHPAFAELGENFVVRDGLAEHISVLLSQLRLTL